MKIGWKHLLDSRLGNVNYSIRNFFECFGCKTIKSESYEMRRVELTKFEKIIWPAGFEKKLFEKDLLQ